MNTDPLQKTLDIDNDNTDPLQKTLDIDNDNLEEEELNGSNLLNSSIFSDSSSDS